MRKQADSEPSQPLGFSEIPAWFKKTVATPSEQASVEVDGVDIHFQSWGSLNQPGVLLIHGGAAHSHWWDHIAPYLAKDHRVVALDLSGHGDSGRREKYTLEQWAKEAISVCRTSGMNEKPIVIGHSLGGMVALIAAKEYGVLLHGAVAIDSRFRNRTPEEQAAIQHTAFGPLHVYATREEILGKFRTIPKQEVLSYIGAYIAEKSIREVSGGWSWKFDPRIFDPNRKLPETWETLECRVNLFRSEMGIVTADMADVIYEKMGRVAPVIEIPGAGHAAMLDQPLALVLGIRTLIADWEHSLPLPQSKHP